MDASGAVVGIVVGVATGIAAAVVTKHKMDAAEELALEERIEDARHRAFNEGWQEASSNANNVRQAYVRLFESPDEEAGTVVRQSRR